MKEDMMLRMKIIFDQTCIQIILFSYNDVLNIVKSKISRPLFFNVLYVSVYIARLFSD